LQYFTFKFSFVVDSWPDSWQSRNDSFTGATADAAFAPVCFFGPNGLQLANGNWQTKKPLLQDLKIGGNEDT